MITLLVNNKHVRIRDAKASDIRKLEVICSYMIAGAYFSRAFQNKVWDGREHLLKYSTKHGYRAPIGLREDIENYFTEAGKKYRVKFSNKRKKPRHNIEYGWDESVVLRKYQNKAVKSITKGKFKGTGILMLPIRSGKTKTAARVIHDLKVTTLFIVPSTMLLHQTHKALEETLCIKVGIIGDEQNDIQDVTVITAQSLTVARKRNDAAYKEFCEMFDLVIFDECHHLVAEGWHDAMMDIDAPYRIGLSATAFLDSDSENEKGVIWLKACCGGIKSTITTSELIDLGHLMKPDIQIYPIYEPDLNDQKWSQSLRNEAIYENEYRNNKIVHIVKREVKDNLKVLIVTNRISQVGILSEMLDEAGIDHLTITGSDRGTVREERVDAFVSGMYPVLVGTVFAEGIDIPEIECVINAEGGLDVKTTVQRMRNLTKMEGKTKAVFVDFADMTNSYFAKHSKERIKMYRSEPAFEVRIMK